MPRATDGTPFHSFSRAKHHDEAQGEKKSAKPAMEKKPAGEEKPEHEGGEDIKSVVAQHGPAHEVHVHHDHEGKTSHVISHHGEHKHEEDFEGEDHAAMAHKHAHEAAGGESEPDDDEEAGETYGEALPEMETEEAHGHIPGLR
jgi:hypothetical protein